MTSFISVPSLHLSEPRVVDRPDLEIVVVYLNDSDMAQIDDPAIARALAAAFTQAAELREAQIAAGPGRPALPVEDPGADGAWGGQS